VAVLNSVPPPTEDPISKPRRAEYKGDARDPQEGFVNDRWEEFFNYQTDLTEKFPARVNNVALTAQLISIGATDITDGTLTAGQYRISFYVRVTTAEALATVVVTLDWQEGGVTRTHTSASLDCSSTGNYISQPSLPINVTALTPVRYATTVTALGALRYALDVNLEEVKA